MLLPHTDLVGAEKFMTRLLIQSQELLDMSFCSGITTHRTGEGRDVLLERARVALASAKQEGKKSIRCIINQQDELALISF